MVVNTVKALIKISIEKDKTYMKDTILLLLFDFVNLLIQILFFKVIFMHFNTIKGITFNEIIFIVITAQIIEILHDSFFAGGFSSMSSWVAMGKFDYFLLLPQHRELVMNLYEMNMKNLMEIVFPLLLLMKYNPFKCFWDITLYIIFILLGLFVRYSFGYFIASLAVIYTRVDTLQIIESMLFGYSMFPYIIYKQVAKWIFVVIIPLGLVANIPFAYFSYHSLYLVFLAIIIGGIYLILGKLIYIIFLKKYQSAGG